LEKFLDSGERVLDVGTGGGVPGILLAILRPDLEVSLCDSVQKKARVAQDIVEKMNLPISVYAQSVTDILKQKQFDSLVARAVAPMAKVLTWVNPHWDAFKQLLLIKGPAWTQERQEAREKGTLRDLSLRKLASYPFPGTTSESVVLVIRSKDED
jgi:16S rRNA (guanine527-N7)-methyltransferase